MLAFRLAWAFLLTGFSFSSAVYAADGRYSLAGTVVDPSGVGVSNARVTLETISGGTPRAASTDASGSFRFFSLPAGAFQLRVEAEGFAEARTPIEITGRSLSDISIPLRIAGMRQEITVNEAAGQINTEASSNLDVITLDRDLLDNLPIFDQNYVGAMSQFLDPGSISTGGVTLVVNGMEQKNIGVSASAIQQVKINQNPYSAEFAPRQGTDRDHYQA